MSPISRRTALGFAGATAVLPVLASVAGTPSATNADRSIAALEQRYGGRLGVAIINLATGATASNRDDERFLICSTFKTLLAAFVLARVDRGEERLDQRIVFAADKLVPHAPITGERVGEPGMTIAELCEATVTTSDNPAANLLLETFGGPPSLTAFLREIGDATTRLDRFETELNEHEFPGDQRDTTTPVAMITTLRRLFFGDVLLPQSRAQLFAWHVNNKTGYARLRAGFPADWLVACKTGTNGSGNSNHVGVAFAPDRGATLVAVYCEMPGVPGTTRDTVIAEIARIAMSV